MAKPIQTLLLLASALYLFSLVNTAHGKEDPLHVEGEVYCDRCRAQFKNRLSEPISGATVRLECRDPETVTNITLSVEGKTDASGNYNIEVDGDHENEVCQVVLVSSPRADCNEVPKEAYEPLSSRITLTSQTGMADTTRHANPLGFMAKEAVPGCIEVYKELDMLPDDLVP